MSGKRTTNRAAFARADVAAAKRGAPSVNLHRYAAARHLRFLDRVTPAGYRACVPADPELQANVVLGTLPGGEHGILAHESLRLPIARGDRVVGRVLRGQGDNRRWIHTSKPDSDHQRPLSSPDTSSPDALAPCTVAAVRLPETVAVQQRLRIDRIKKAPPFDSATPATLTTSVSPAGEFRPTHLRTDRS